MVQKKEKLLRAITSYADFNFIKTVNDDIFSYSTNDFKFNEVYNFWDKNHIEINQLIKKNEFDGNDFNKISKSFNILFDNYIKSNIHFNSNKNPFDNKEEQTKIDNLSSINYEEINPIFKEICQYFITLSLKKNEKIDRYLIIFDPESLYYKKIKALSLIRFYDGEMEDYKYLFRDISLLLSDAIDLSNETGEQKECIKIAIEYLEKIFYIEPSREIFLNTYSTPKFLKQLKENSFFNRRYSQFEDIDGIYNDFDKTLDTKGLINIINGIIKNENLKNGKEYTLNKIKKLHKNLFNEYSKLEIAYKEQTKIRDTINQTMTDALDKQVEFRDSNPGLYSKYFRYQNVYYHNEIYDELLFNRIEEELCNIENVEQHCHYHILNEVPENEIEKLKNKLSKRFNCEFDIAVLPQELWQPTIDENESFAKIPEEENKRYDLKFELTKLASKIIWEVYNYNNKDYENTQTNNDENISNKKQNNKEIDEDQIDYENAKKNIEKLNNTLNAYKESLSFYYNESHKLSEEIEKLRTILKNNKLLPQEEIKKEEDIIEKRKYYRFTVIGGGGNSIDGYKNLQKNKDFWNNIYKQHHLEQKQFELSGDMNKQNDRKRVKGIENKLLLNNNDLVIILQLDHKTPLFNVVSSLKYSSKITLIGENNKGIICNDQKFTHRFFEEAIKCAIDKFETVDDNSTIGLN